MCSWQLLAYTQAIFLFFPRSFKSLSPAFGLLPTSQALLCHPLSPLAEGSEDGCFVWLQALKSLDPMLSGELFGSLLWFLQLRLPGCPCWSALLLELQQSREEFCWHRQEMVKSLSYHLGKRFFDFSEGANMLHSVGNKGKEISFKSWSWILFSAAACESWILMSEK